MIKWLNLSSTFRSISWSLQTCWCSLLVKWFKHPIEPLSIQRWLLLHYSAPRKAASSLRQQIVQIGKKCLECWSYTQLLSMGQLPHQGALLALGWRLFPALPSLLTWPKLTGHSRSHSGGGISANNQFQSKWKFSSWKLHVMNLCCVVFTMQGDFLALLQRKHC